MKQTLKSLFENIFWPAAAGNVIWSLSNVSIEDWSTNNPVCACSIKNLDCGCLIGNLDCSCSMSGPSRSFVLLVLSVYLVVGWLRIKSENEPIDCKYWFFEFFHLSAITLAAVSAHVKPQCLHTFLVIYYLITASWASVGWIFPGTRLPSDKEGTWIPIMFINILGLLVILCRDKSGLGGCIYPISFLITLVFWFGVRWSDIEMIESRLKSNCLKPTPDGPPREGEPGLSG